MQKYEKVKIGMDRIEDMILLADEVVSALQLKYADYTEEGDEIFYMCYKAYEDMEDRDAFHDIVRKAKEPHRKHEYLLWKLFRGNTYDLTDVLELSAEELIEKHLSPIIEKAVCLFRKGTDQFTGFIADESVPDSYLRKLFAMRVRDMMIVFACQRFKQKYYLLVLRNKGFYNRDRWLGIYTNLKKLRETYERFQDEGCLHPELEQLMIFQFEDEKEGYSHVTQAELWGDKYI